MAGRAGTAARALQAPRPAQGALKVLILKPSSLGDVVQALPLLRLLKRHRPGSAIYWWIESSLAPLLEDDPDLAGVVRFERRRWASPRHWPEVLQQVRWLRQQRFDWVIDLQSLLRTGAFAWLANGGLLIGLDEAREGARGFYDIIVPRPSFYTHAVDWYLAVLPALGLPADGQFEWLPPRPAVARAIQERWQIQGARWVALQPGARWENKRWPAAYFAELVRRLAARFDRTRFVILGAREDAPLAEEIARAAPERCLNLAGRTALPELVEWLRLASVLVTNDTGPMHIAAALGTPLVALFGPTEPRRTGPYGRADAVLQLSLPCVPCMKPRCRWPRPVECLKALLPEAVFERVAGILAGG